jgi:hypothetical protein
VSLVLHGHAHRGRLQGATKSGAPVYNVSMPLLTRSVADKPPFRVFELTIAERESSESRPTPPSPVPTGQPALTVAPAATRGGRRATDAVAS